MHMTIDIYIYFHFFIDYLIIRTNVCIRDTRKCSEKLALIQESLLYESIPLISVMINRNLYSYLLKF